MPLFRPIWLCAPASFWWSSVGMGTGSGASKEADGGGACDFTIGLRMQTIQCFLSTRRIVSDRYPFVFQ